MPRKKVWTDDDLHGDPLTAAAKHVQAILSLRSDLGTKQGARRVAAMECIIAHSEALAMAAVRIPARANETTDRSELLSTADIAETIGCDETTVRRIAKRIGVGVPSGNSLVFMPADLARIQADYNGGPGNPFLIAPQRAIGKPS